MTIPLLRRTTKDGSAATMIAFVVLVGAGLAVSCKPSRAQSREASEHNGHTGATPTAAAAEASGSSSPSSRSTASPPTTTHAGHLAPAAAATTGASLTPAGYAAVSIEPSRAAAIGLTTSRVEERDFVRQLRTTGIVVVDETRTTHVHSKVRGWVDGINVNYVGQKVAPGQQLCGIYSQEVYAAEMEYLALLGRTRAVEPLLGGGGAGNRSEFAMQERNAREELISAARRRLGLWDVPKSEIERLESSREPRRTFPLLAPRAGVVVSKQVLDGTFVDPSTELYTVSDLSRVWLLADVYESDVGAIQLGQAARLNVQGAGGPGAPEGAIIEAKVAFLPPTIDEPTRTLKIRFELANERGRLRPGAFANVMMDLSLGRGLAVPENAVIRTGARSIVFVVHDDHNNKSDDGGKNQHIIMPREIKLGPLVDNFYRVDAGLVAGDVVATGAQFLLDSETRLRASSGTGALAGHGGH